VPGNPAGSGFYDKGDSHNGGFRFQVSGVRDRSNGSKGKNEKNGINNLI
jgi:hypothetical protein